MRRVPGLLAVLAIMALLSVGLLGKAVSEDAASLDAALVKLAPPPSGEALTRIPDPGRKLLALRSYVRYGAKIADRWSWTKKQIEAFEGSPEQRDCLPRSLTSTDTSGRPTPATTLCPRDSA